MAIAGSAAVVALSATGWKSVGGQLLASGVLVLSGHQDIGLRAHIGAAFGFFMAIAFGMSALVSAIRGNLRYRYRNMRRGSLLRNSVDSALVASEREFRLAPLNWALP